MPLKLRNLSPWLLGIILVGCAVRSPTTAVEGYVRAVWARDYATAYDYLSADDRAALSKESYLGQYESFEGAQLEIARRLASLVEFQNPQLTEAGDTATIVAHLRVPDGNAPAVAAILDQAGRRGADVAALQASVDDLVATAQLPFLEGDQTFELRRNVGGWGVYLRLGEAARVTFTTGVQAGLPWRFEPLQTSALLLPGDLVRAQFRVKNLSDQSVTGKADEDTTPESLADHLDFYQCFCMLQLTLAPGESQTLTVVLRLIEPLPADANELEVHYDFYPIEAFPDSGEDMHGSEGMHESSAIPTVP